MSSALVVFVIEHSQKGYCRFSDASPTSMVFKDHPATATTFKDLSSCLEKLTTLKTLPSYSVGVEITAGLFYIIEVAVSAHARPTRYSVRPYGESPS